MSGVDGEDVVIESFDSSKVSHNSDGNSIPISSCSSEVNRPDTRDDMEWEVDPTEAEVCPKRLKLGHDCAVDVQDCSQTIAQAGLQADTILSNTDAEPADAASEQSEEMTPQSTDSNRQIADPDAVHTDSALNQAFIGPVLSDASTSQSQEAVTPDDKLAQQIGA